MGALGDGVGAAMPPNTCVKLSIGLGADGADGRCGVAVASAAGGSAAFGGAALAAGALGELAGGPPMPPKICVKLSPAFAGGDAGDAGGAAVGAGGCVFGATACVFGATAWNCRVNSPGSGGAGGTTVGVAAAGGCTSGDDAG